MATAKMTTTTAPAAKTNGKAATKSQVSPQRADVLKALKKSKGTLENIIARTKLPERAAYHHLWHLRKDGFVKATATHSDASKDGVLVFELTAKGTKLAASC